MNQDPILTAISAIFGVTDFSNVLTWVMGIMTGIAVAIIIYGGVLYTASGGNKSLADEGKKWITAAISGIVMLIVAYIVLNTVNPAVFRLEGFSLPPVSTTATNPNSGVINITNGPTTGPAGLQPLAQQLMNNPNITIDSSGECDSSSGNPGGGSSNPLANIQNTANGLLPYVCAQYSSSGTGIVGSCDCVRGGPAGSVSLNPNMLSALLQMANSGYKFDITSLATGIHGGSCYSDGSCFSYGNYHGHYSGEAVDLVPTPTPTTPGQWTNMKNEISSLNSSYCGSQSIFYCESGSTIEKSCQVPTTDHIHWTCTR